jgi:hypothetical protein
MDVVAFIVNSGAFNLFKKHCAGVQKFYLQEGSFFL